MKELLLMGDCKKDFERLGVTLRVTYRGEAYSVAEVTDDEFEVLCKEPNPDIADKWEGCGWRYAGGSNKGIADKKITINGCEVIAWKGNDVRDKYDKLLEYFCRGCGAAQPRNVCALAVELSMQNGLKMSELFEKCQGNKIY